MTRVNKLLVVEKDLSTCIFKCLGMPNVVFPELSGVYLYSDLSNRIHEPDLGGKVFVGKDVKNDLKFFYYNVAPLFELNIEVY